ncbi:MAG: ABC transporter ATP-binding protein [Thaumarchaeota archaeon]|nr:ABC transporter ATP-binding protein [Nitrososphaerota archaeon]
MGVVYERACFPTSYKVIEYLERACRIFGKPKYRAKEVLLEVGLYGSENKPIKGLSAGMLQKFSVAHALVHEPRLIIADEPTANLDSEARGNLLSLILKLNRDKKITFLISSHILFELSRVCNSMVIINRGKVWASGKLDDLLNKLKTKLVRVSTDKPEELAAEVKKLSYVAHIEADVRSILIGVTSEDYNHVYSDILDIAKNLELR